uniref:RRM domain-containing protein n=1 Tax=Anopheles dirus TaxID=7168 RepID=A0A182MZP8_9DIPT
MPYDPGARMLYVCDLHPAVHEQQLVDMFIQCGPVRYVRVLRDARTGRSLRQGYIRFNREVDACHAIEELNYTLVHGQPMRVMWLVPNISDRLRNTHGNVFFQNLEGSIDARALYATFVEFGEILNCRVVQNGPEPGHGYVHFADESVAQCVIALVDGKLINGLAVQVGPHPPPTHHRTAQPSLDPALHCEPVPVYQHPGPAAFVQDEYMPQEAFAGPWPYPWPAVLPPPPAVLPLPPAVLPLPPAVLPLPPVVLPPPPAVLPIPPLQAPFMPPVDQFACQAMIMQLNQVIGHGQFMVSQLEAQRVAMDRRMEPIEEVEEEEEQEQYLQHEQYIDQEQYLEQEMEQEQYLQQEQEIEAVEEPEIAPVVQDVPHPLPRRNQCLLRGVRCNCPQLFLAGLPYQYRNKELHALCAPFGPIVRVSVVMRNRAALGYGFVCFAVYEHAVRAEEMLNGSVVNNRTLTVRFTYGTLAEMMADADAAHRDEPADPEAAAGQDQPADAPERPDPDRPAHRTGSVVDWLRDDLCRKLLARRVANLYPQKATEITALMVEQHRDELVRLVTHDAYFRAAYLQQRQVLAAKDEGATIREHDYCRNV